jgi:hypothetical protein
MTMKAGTTPSAEGAPTEESTRRQISARSGMSSRRKVLAKRLGVAAVTVGVGAVVEMSG